MDFRIVALGELTSQDLRAWRELADVSREPNANADPRFLLAALGQGLKAEELSLAIVEDGESFQLVMPFTVGSRIAGARSKHLTTHGAFMHEFASKNHPLIGPGEPRVILGTLFDGLQHSPYPDLVDFTVLPVDSVIVDGLHALEADGSVRMVERVRDDRAFARRNDLSALPESEWYARPDDILSFPAPHLSTKSKKNLGSSGRQIQRTVGGPLELTEHDDDPAIIEEFLDLQAAGWKGDAALTGPQFRRKGQESWFRLVTQAFRNDDRLRVVKLSAGGRTVYIAVYLVSGGWRFGFHDVFDEEFRRSSPGFVGRLALLGHVMRDPASLPFDPGMEPWYAQANTVYPSRRTHANILVAGRSLRSRSVVKLLPFAKRTRDALRRGSGKAN